MLKKLSKKGKIGAAIGCVAAILIVALVAVLSCGWMRQRRGRQL